MTDAPAPLSVTVVIATRDRADSVERIVRDVLGQDYGHLDVLVVVDGSTDDTVERLGSLGDPRLEVLEAPRRGANRARNLGATHARGDYLVFLDDDDAVRPGWLSALMAAAGEGGAHLVSCALERVDRNWENPIVEAPAKLGPIFAGLEAQFLGGAFAVRADLFHEVGGYPDELPSNQQTGLALRLAARHERDPIVTATTSAVGIVWHQRRRGPGGVPASFATNRLRGALMLLEEYPDRYARDPRERGNYLSVAATCAARIGEFRTSRWLYWRAYQSHRGRGKDLARIVLTFFPPLARRVWPVDWDLPEPEAPTGLRVVEAVQGVASGAAVPRRVREEIDALRAAGHTVTVMVNDAPHPGVPLPENWPVRVVGPRARMLRRSSIKPVVLGWYLRRAVRRERPDVLVVHHPVPARIAGPAARRAGVPTIVVVHSLVHEEARLHANPHRRATTAVGRWGERALRRATVVAPVSEALVNPLLGLRVRLDRILVLRNVVDTTRFRPGDGERDVDVLYVGRLSPEKGPQDLLEACRRLPPEARVRIVGSGRMRARLERLARDLPCRVDFTGILTHEELAACYRRARLVVVPSRTDARPNVVLEAMASGVPVVASRVGGIPETVEDGVQGWLVEPGDTDALGDAILRALASDLEAMSEAARQRAERFDPEDLHQRFVDLVLDVVTAAPR